MAPEVLRGQSATPASDLYSLGVVLFQMVTGRYPVEAETLDELREAHERGPLPSVRHVRQDVPLAFSRVIDHALEREPAVRVRTASELERLLSEALAADWGPTSVPANPSRPRHPWRQLAGTWAWRPPCWRRRSPWPGRCSGAPPPGRRRRCSSRCSSLRGSACTSSPMPSSRRTAAGSCTRRWTRWAGARSGSGASTRSAARASRHGGSGPTRSGRRTTGTSDSSAVWS